MAEPDERFCHSMCRIELILQHAQPESMWEIIEDNIADSLANLGIHGELTCSVTGNTVQIIPEREQ